MTLRIDVYERAGELVVEVEAPGVEPERLRVTLHEDRVALAIGAGAGAGTDVRRWHRRERRPAALVREIPLPRPIDPDAARAQLVHGLLTLRLPLRHPARSRSRGLALVEDAADAA